MVAAHLALTPQVLMSYHSSISRQVASDRFRLVPFVEDAHGLSSALAFR
jgi:hypothetical protein